MKIKHDFHIHTSLSVCAKETATVEHYLKTAKKLGFNKIGFADHFWDDKINCGDNRFYQRQGYAHVEQLKPILADIKENDLKTYFGCETEYDSANRGVAVTEEVAERFDFIIVPNSHTHMMMPKDYYEPYQKHVDFMIQAYEDILDCNVSRYITAMAHPFEAVCCPYPNNILIDMIPDDCFKRLFDKQANKGIAFEINVSSMNRKTTSEIEACSQIRMFKIAKECGCKFLFGSDSHSDHGHDAYANADFVAGLLDLKEDDIAEIAR